MLLAVGQHLPPDALESYRNWILGCAAEADRERSLVCTVPLAQGASKWGAFSLFKSAVCDPKAERKWKRGTSAVLCGACGSDKALVGLFTAKGDGGQGEGLMRNRGGQGLDEGPLTPLHRWSEQKSLEGLSPCARRCSEQIWKCPNMCGAVLYQKRNFGLIVPAFHSEQQSPQMIHWLNTSTSKYF